MDSTLILYILILLTSYPIAQVLHKLTKDEIPLTNFYFPYIITALTIATIFLIIKAPHYSLTTFHTLLTILFWHQINQNRQRKSKAKSKRTKNKKHNK